MAIETAMRRVARRVARVLDEFAAAKGWRREEYQVFFWLNVDWGRIHVIFVAKGFPGNDSYDQWALVNDFPEQELKDTLGLAESIDLSLQTFAEVEEGGLYAIGPDFVTIEELFGIDPAIRSSE